jgi:hypothetical protein
MKLQILQAANKIMEVSRMYKLPDHRSKPNDFGMWKLKRAWSIHKGDTDVRWYHCPMHIRFGCRVQIKVIEDAHEIALLTVMHMIRINPSISRFSSYMPFRLEFASLQLSEQECCGAILSISIRKSVSIQNIVAASGARCRHTVPSSLWSS